MKQKKVSEFSKNPTEDKILLICGYTLLGLFVAAIIVPIIYIILASFIDPITLQNSGLTFDFSKWPTTAYGRVLGNSQIWVGFKNALIYSVLFTFISVIITLLAAYPMSRSDFRFKRFFNTVYVITMFFGGGLILLRRLVRIGPETAEKAEQFDGMARPKRPLSAVTDATEDEMSLRKGAPDVS